MWIYLSDAYLSIVAVNGAPHPSDQLLVRARHKGDIERVWPNAHVEITPKADYRYRSFISRPDVAAAIARAVADIGYPNFKNSVKDPARHEAYLGCWSAMNSWQRAER
jgi:hypothetical protein